MALLWIEGFEGFGTTPGSVPLPVGALDRKYVDTPGNSSWMDIEVGRLGGYCLEIGDGKALGMVVPTTDATLICGVAFNKYNDINRDYEIVAFYDGAQRGIGVTSIAATGELEVKLDGSLLGTTSGLGLLDNTWYWLELKVVTDNAAGEYEVRVGGVSVLSDSGLDTQGGSNAWSDKVSFRAPTGGSAVQIDDIYICDGTGGVNDDFLGGVKVVGLSPDADDTANFGTSTPSANHFENVDENPSDDDTSYVEENTVNTTDLYDYEALSDTGEVFGLQINTICRETDATLFSLITPIESNGTQDDGSSQPLTGVDYTNLHRVSEVDPDTNTAWTINGVDAAKFGIKVG